MWRYDYSVILPNHFELILVIVFYLVYFVFSDYENSRRNQFAMYFDEALMHADSKTDYEAEYAGKS